MLTLILQLDVIKRCSYLLIIYTTWQSPVAYQIVAMNRIYPKHTDLLVGGVWQLLWMLFCAIPCSKLSRSRINSKHSPDVLIFWLIILLLIFLTKQKRDVDGSETNEPVGFIDVYQVNYLYFINCNLPDSLHDININN